MPSLAYSKEVFDVSEFHEPLVAEQMLVQFLQCHLTQKIGIALAGLGKFYDRLTVGRSLRRWPESSRDRSLATASWRGSARSCRSDGSRRRRCRESRQSGGGERAGASCRATQTEHGRRLTELANAMEAAKHRRCSCLPSPRGRLRYTARLRWPRWRDGQP
jgi:hypothetical protein